MRPLLDGPLDAAEQHVGGAAAVVIEHLAYEPGAHPGGDTDAPTVHGSPEDGPGAVCAVTLPVAAAGAGEVLLDERHAGEGDVRGIDTGVEDRHDRTSAVPSGPVRPDGSDPPGVGDFFDGARGGAARIGVRNRSNQLRRHHRCQSADLRVARQLVQVSAAHGDGVQAWLLHRPTQG